MQPGAEIQPPPMHSANQGNYGPVPPAQSSPFAPNQGGYVQQPPVAAPLGMQHMPPPGSASSIQGLTEDFSSLAVQTRPGTIDQVFDAKELPRPLDGDVEPNNLAEMYPMNCNPRYLRLTTGALPSSQSLASRWHLPLGAVVCPLAESPDGVSACLTCLMSSNMLVLLIHLLTVFCLQEEVPTVNFAPASVVRCRRCRTYVNPYVTFTEAGRKFRCNVCTLLNDGISFFTALAFALLIKSPETIKWYESRLSQVLQASTFLS